MLRVTAIVLNVATLLFTTMVCLSDGMPTNLWYLGFTWLLLGLPPLTAWTLWQLRAPGALPSRARWLVGGLNALMVALIIAALVDQHPHPDEPGFLPYVVLICVTPLLSGWLLLRPTRRAAGTAAH